MAKFSNYVENYKKQFSAKCFIFEALLLIVVLCFDLISKQYMAEFLLTQPNATYPFINGFMDFSYTENTGASFGIFAGKTDFLIIFVAISIALLFLYWIFFAREAAATIKISIIFIIAGGIGNLVDRIWLGYVRDFLRFTFFDFPIFNVADSFIVIGTFMLIIYLVISLIKEMISKNKEKNNA